MTKKKTTTYDLIVIGGGSAGFSAAEVASAQGKSVCLIERDLLGGECPNWACVPTKSLLKSAKAYYHAKHSLSDLGLSFDDLRFSFARIMARKDNVVEAVTGRGRRIGEIAKALKIDLKRGRARFVDKNTVQVGSNRIKAKKIIIATGAVPFIPPIAGLKQAGFLTFKEAVSLKRKPDSLVIVGGGPVACEFATFFALLETKVTLLQLGPGILEREDQELSLLAQKQLSSYGVKVLTGAKTLSVKQEGRQKRVAFQVGEGRRQTVLVNQILIATGKRANVQELKLEKAGVKLDQKGRLVVNDYLQTSAKHIFAAGDVTGGMQFTHTAHAEGYIAATNAFKNGRGLLKRNERVVPRVTFIEPELASVGITSQEALKLGKQVVLGSFPVGALGRAVTDGQRIGLCKLVVDKKTRQILGGHILGARAGEVIHEIALAMEARVTVDQLGEMIHAYPTYSEVVNATAARI